MGQAIGEILPQAVDVAKTFTHLRTIGWVFYLLATLVVAALVVTLEVLALQGLASTSERGPRKGARDRLGV